MFQLLVLCCASLILADSVRYQVSLTPIEYSDSSNFVSTGAARLVTVNLGLENCANPTPAQPCGWGLARSAGYESHEGKNFYSGGQRNAFGVAKTEDNLAGFWADASLQTDDLPGDLITAEKDLRVEYGNFDLRFKTPKTLVNGIHQGSSPIYVSGEMDLAQGGNFGACFRLFDNSPADRPNSFDLIATGAFADGAKPSAVNSDVVYGFWANGVVGRCSEDAANSFYNSGNVKPTVSAHSGDEQTIRAVLGARANLALEGVEQTYAQPVFGVDGAEIANDEEGVSGFVQEDAQERRVAVWPLVYSQATTDLNDRVQQACSLNDAGECVFRPVAYATATPCDFGLQKRSALVYFQ
jgi:hypothetical protein